MKDLLKEMHSWMNSYMKSFYTTDAEVQKGIEVKEIHTGYVTTHAVSLAKHLGMNEHDVYLAEIMGLFHDVGRFRQFAVYKTFNDAESEDHANLGLKVLDELPFMKKLEPIDEALVRFAIKNHNKKEIEPCTDGRKLTFAKLLRDADKLDIYRVLLPYLEPSGALVKNPGFIRTNGEVGISPDFLVKFVAGEQVDYTLLRTQDDRKLVRLMWLYDVNYSWTLKKILEAGYMDSIIECLPKGNVQVDLGVKRLKEYVAKKCQTTDSIDK